jgi:hypothetical protein
LKADMEAVYGLEVKARMMPPANQRPINPE